MPDAFLYLLKGPDNPDALEYHCRTAERKAFLTAYLSERRSRAHQRLRSAGLYADDPADSKIPALNRPAMKAIMFRAEPGDVIVLDTVFYNFRGLTDLRCLCERALARHCELHFAKERLRVFPGGESRFHAKPLSFLRRFAAGVLAVRKAGNVLYCMNAKFTAYHTLGEKPEQRAAMAWITWLRNDNWKFHEIAKTMKNTGVKFSHWRWRGPTPEAIEVFYMRACDLGIEPSREWPEHWGQHPSAPLSIAKDTPSRQSRSCV